MFNPLLSAVRLHTGILTIPLSSKLCSFSFIEESAL
jgi:hypothetical protein